MRGLLRFMPGFNWLSRKRILHRYHHDAQLLLKGRHRNTSSLPGILYFGTTRSGADQAAKVFIRALVRSAGMAAIDFDGYSFNGGRSSSDIFAPSDHGHDVYSPRGYFFGPFRRYNPGIGRIEDYRTILQLRDPRDVLVSLYYSTAYSHNIPFHNPELADEYLARRRAALGMSIDTFVLQHAGQLREVYQEYLDNLVDHANVLLLKYETMVTDFDAWLDAVVKFLDFDGESEAVAEVRKDAERLLRVKGENIYRERRQMTPGDFRRKLQPATVDSLTMTFHQTLERLGYGL